MKLQRNSSRKNLIRLKELKQKLKDNNKQGRNKRGEFPRFKLEMEYK
jgi:hypothetical protein